jgi:hypothetical protein
MQKKITVLAAARSETRFNKEIPIHYTYFMLDISDVNIMNIYF